MINTLTLKEIRKALKIDGEIKINDVEIIINGIGEAELSKKNEYVFTSTSWYEIEDYLIENEIINL